MFLSYDLVDRVAKVAAVNSHYGTVNAFFNVLTRDLPMTKLQCIFPWSIMRRSMRLFQSHALATHWQNDVALPAQFYQSLLAWTSLDPESLQTHKAFLSTFFNGDGFLLGGCRPNLALIYTALDWFLFQVVVTDWQIRVDRIRSQSRILLPYNSLAVLAR